MDPVSLAVGGLLALVFGVAIFNSDDDDSSSDGGTQENSAGLTLDPETGTVTGTDDDDTITTAALGDSPADYLVVNAGAGDDTVVADPEGINDPEIWVDGGDGDDVLTVIGAFNSRTEGGAGDDVLNVSPTAAGAYGGEGNDTINYDDSHRVTFEDTRVHGGAGDDVINGTMDTTAYHSRVNFYTGDGADEMNLTLDLDDVVIETDHLGELMFDGSMNVTSVQDFDPQNDILTIDPTSHLDGSGMLNGQTAEITYTGYDVTEDELGTLVTLNYDAVSASETLNMTLTVHLFGVTDVPADAIRIVTG